MPLGIERRSHVYSCYRWNAVEIRPVLATCVVSAALSIVVQYSRTITRMIDVSICEDDFHWAPSVGDNFALDVLVGKVARISVGIQIS